MSGPDVRPRRRVARLAAALAVIAPAIVATGAQGAGPVHSFELRAGRVVVNCPLTVGGSFDAVTDSLAGTLATDAGRPDVVSGTLVVALETLDTGIGLRNQHLRERYLEVDRGDEYARAVLTDIVLADAPAAGLAGRTPFSGSLTLHGVTRPVRGEAAFEPHPEGRQVSARFTVSLSAFEIPPPRYLGIGVRDEVEVHVEFLAAETRQQGVP